MSNELATTNRSIAPVNVAEMLTDIVKAGLTADSAIAVKELVMLQQQQQDRAARQSFVETFARVLSRTKKVNATRANPTKPDANGRVTIRWWMASLEDLQTEVEPICLEEGISFHFNSRRDPSAPLIVIGQCIVSHIATGHTEVFECGYNSASAQGGDLGALTSAKRGAMIAAFRLKVGHIDGDARMLGDFVSPDMAAELRDRLLATGRDERKFLALAGVTVPLDARPSFDDWKRIRQGKIGVLHQMLAKVEGVKQTAAQGEPAPANVDVKTGEVIEAEGPTPAGREAFLIQINEAREAAGLMDRKAFDNEIKKWALKLGIVGKEHKASAADVQKLLEDIANRVGAFA